MTETPDEWINKFFEFHFCDVCGGDVEDHEVCLVPGIGTYFARCKRADGGDPTEVAPRIKHHVPREMGGPGAGG